MLKEFLRQIVRPRNDPRSSVAAGINEYELKHYDKALAHFNHAIKLDPSNNEYRYHAACAEFMLGRNQQAWRRCEEVLERDLNFGLCHTLMSSISLPGPPYTDVLASIHEALRPRTYVEIGVSYGKAVRLARPETRVVGIDPAPKWNGPLPPNVAIYAMESDAYFANRDLKQDLGGRPVDLAFIDGLHHFEFALRDFISVERACTPASTILVHDWYPLNRHTAERVFHCRFFSGDVWRLALALKKYRPDLEIATIATAPTGLGIVRGLDPGSTVLMQNYETIVSEFMALDYGVLDADKPGMLNLVPNDWDKVRALLRAPASAG